MPPIGKETFIERLAVAAHLQRKQNKTKKTNHLKVVKDHHHLRLHQHQAILVVIVAANTIIADVNAGDNESKNMDVEQK